MEKIKLVIWDLDETFWNGTLSEEGIIPIPSNIELVKELTNRGIINSIVSKNDFEQAKSKLIELGVWNLFVFPKIEWKSKGSLIKSVIENCQLRDVNVLFLDDNHLNLKEAIYYNPNLHAKLPEFIPEILSNPAFKGKDDKSHSRLKQYKLLEKRQEAETNYKDNSDFLRSSNIQLNQVTGSDLLHHLDRIHELIDRTNQLNFTKLRITKEEVKVLLEDKSYHTSLIHVIDNFGDYGFVGFYALHKEKKLLEHFVFSCRILNLGVPQYIFQSLHSPKISIVPEVAESLDEFQTIDWIHEVDYLRINDASSQKNNTTLFFKGGCDLGQMMFYLDENNFNILEETNYVSANNFPIHQEHSQVLLDSKFLDKSIKQYALDQSYIPFVDSKFYDSKVFEKGYSCLIYSVLMDYTQELYSHKTKALTLPFGGYYYYWTDENSYDALLNIYEERNIPVTREILQEFKSNFDHIGQISPADFVSNLTKIRKQVPHEIPIIFINGAELESPFEKEKKATERHKIMNSALDDFIINSENTYLVDLRTIVTSKNQLTNNIRHYQREVYREISLELLTILNQHVDHRIKTNLSYKVWLKDKLKNNQFIHKVITKTKRQIKKFTH